ncbi:hypothetical protein LTR85_011316 [Meristemomyces frigidus]|nr:hypothetical protein LTR85_011316 [Meristemomyces frigidus]
MNGTSEANGTVTSTRTIAKTITTASPVPTAFNIFYTNRTDDGVTTQSFARAANVTGGSGTFVLFGGSRDTWDIDNSRRLINDNEPGDFMATNTPYLHPYAFLVSIAPTADTPTCAGCNGTLLCNYPGDSDDQFAMCNGVLALLPPPAVDPDCSNITLQYQ